MKEILEKIKNEINAIKEQQKELEYLTNNAEIIKDEEKKLEQEQSTITDKESGFYKDLSEQIKIKRNEFTEANNKRMNKKSEIDKLIVIKKAEIKAELSSKKQYVDENRNINLEGVDLAKVKAEKEKLEKEIELNNTTKQQFEEMSDSEKMAVKKAKENYLNNKHKLDKINPIVELADTLDGKTPKDKFLEIENLEKMVEENFDGKNLDDFLSSINIIESKTENNVEKVKEGPKEIIKEETREETKEGIREEAREGTRKITREQQAQKETNPVTIEIRDIASNSNKISNPFEYKIIIGNKAKILIGEHEFNIGTRDVKCGVNLSDKEINEILDKYIYKEEEKTLAKQLIKDNAMDTTVLNVICKSGIDVTAKKDMINSYLNKCLVPNEEKNIGIEYNEKALTKVSFIKRLLKHELNNEEKNQIITRAEIAKNKGIATINGEYKPTWKEKIISKINKKALPTQSEKQKAKTIQMIKNDMENGTNIRNRDLSGLNQYIVENKNNKIEKNAMETMDSNEKESQDTSKTFEGRD